MIIDVAAAIVAVAFVVLVGYLVPTLIQIKRTVNEAEQLLARLNSEVPPLVKEVRAMTERLNTLADQSREGVEHASVFLHAVGELGESVQQVHKVVRSKSGSLFVQLASMVAGVRAASAVIRERVLNEGGHSNGGR